MIRAILICPDQDLESELVAAFRHAGGLGFAGRSNRHPGPEELARMVRVHAPQAVFLDVNPWGPAREVLAALETAAPRIPVVALSRGCDPDLLLELMRCGIRELLSPPFGQQALESLVARLEENLSKNPVDYRETELLFAFLPSKPGVGATTLAVNTAAAMANLEDYQVLLADFDLNSGLVRFMLKLESAFSVTDAVEHAASLDENLWPQLVSSRGRLDVLHSGHLNPGQHIEAVQIRYLLEFARRNYKSIFVDLSGNMERYSIEIMREARKILLVCTPELPSLHLAREKIAFLRGIDLGDRVCLLLNRFHRRSPVSVPQVEELLGAPVSMTFPNDYAGAHRALQAGAPVEPGSELGRKVAALARGMTETRPAHRPQPKHRFVEYFSVIPAKYALIPGLRKPPA